MKILIIRHGDPDYEHDSLTEKGWKEARYLSELLEKQKIDAFYVSPLGRAKDTASFTLEKAGKTAKEYEWLREFAVRINRPDVTDRKMIAWDWLPQDWMGEPRFFQYDHWMEPEMMQEGRVKEEYEWVIRGFDSVLETHGYKRNGMYYQAEKPNNDTICFFCHFGLECVLLSHLLNISPMIIWHGFCAAPSSVTTLISEERREGKAVFRMRSFGDLSHLNMHGEEPAYAARFCECYKNEGERRD